MGTPIWRGMDPAELDAAYDNRAAVPESAACLQEWTTRSRALREWQPDLLDLPYGPRPRNRIDLFRAGGRDAPLLVFLHGGYWQRNAKDMFSCMAEGPLARGFDVAVVGYTLAVVGYTLAPEASLTGIVGEIRGAVRWLRREGPAYGISPVRLVVSGWSAGGHLAALVMGMPEVDAGLCVSGIFDLEPIRRGTLNQKLRLTSAEANALSPIRHLPPRAGPLIVAYGTGELDELQRQSRDFQAAWGVAGHRGRLMPVEGRNHFSILADIVNPDGVLATALAALARNLPGSGSGRQSRGPVAAETKLPCF
jgi:arylformamidase